MALLHWEDETGVVHGVTTETVNVTGSNGKKRPTDRWVCLCKVRTFTRGFPPIFIDKESTCALCIAAE